MSQLKIKDGNNWIDIPASGVGVPSGGSSGQFLKKSSSVDYATQWADIPKPKKYHITINTQTISPSMSEPYTLSITMGSAPDSDVYIDNNHIKFATSGVALITANLKGSSSGSSQRLWGNIRVDNAIASDVLIYGSYVAATQDALINFTSSTDVYYTIRSNFI